jgi:hypothetical protein
MNHHKSRPAHYLIWTALAILLIAVVAAVGVWRLFLRDAERPDSPNVELEEARKRETIPVPTVRFTDVTQKAGINFRHRNGAFGKKLLPETMGSGVAFVDLDNDGFPDLLFVNSCHWPGHEPKDQPAPTLALYRNKGDGTFEDVTAGSGLAVTMYGMGVTVGDFDNDSRPDLFVSGVGGNRLFRNITGDDGTKTLRFQDVTATAGVGGPGGWPKQGEGDFLKRTAPLCWSTSAAFLDYDGDGLLDLFVCNYVTWSPADDLKQGFSLTGAGRAYGPPTAFEGAQCFLYRNLGNGKFADVSKEAGVQVFEKEGTDESGRQRNGAKSLGVIVCDVDEDGWPDIVVANDTVRNFLFHNVPGPNGTRRFEETGILSGIAYAEGTVRGAMGVDWVDDYRPGMRGLLIGNFANEPNTFLCVDDARKLRFSDMALAEGLAGPSREFLKFGVFAFDYDLDGRLDLLTCNGHLEPEISQIQRSQRYRQPVQLFWNTGRQPRGFEPVTEKAAGSDLFQPIVGRGCAFGSMRNDGRLDVVLTDNGGAARLLANEGQTGHHWIRLHLEGDGKHSNRSAIGARVKVEANGLVQRREVVSARGYLSQSEFVLTFGLADATKIDRITVQWPGRDSGPPTELKDVGVDQTLRVVQEVK